MPFLTREYMVQDMLSFTQMLECPRDAEPWVYSLVLLVGVTRLLTYLFDNASKELVLKGLPTGVKP